MFSQTSRSTRNGRELSSSASCSSATCAACSGRLKSTRSRSEWRRLVPLTREPKAQTVTPGKNCCSSASSSLRAAGVISRVAMTAGSLLIAKGGLFPARAGHGLIQADGIAYKVAHQRQTQGGLVAIIIMGGADARIGIFEPLLDGRGQQQVFRPQTQ